MALLHFFPTKFNTVLSFSTNLIFIGFQMRPIRGSVHPSVRPSVHPSVGPLVMLLLSWHFLGFHGKIGSFVSLSLRVFYSQALTRSNERGDRLTILLFMFHAISRLSVGRFCDFFDEIITTSILQNAGKNRILLSSIRKEWERIKDYSLKGKITTTHDFF